MDSLEDTTKKFITSLLTSTPLVVTMYQLSKDYRNTIGEPIPYQKLGYNSLEHFLRSIDDTVLVKGSGPTAQVIPVFSEKSAHVNTLVAKQKLTKPKNKRNFQSRRMTYYPSGNLYSNKEPLKSSRKIHYPVTKDVSTSKSSSQSLASLEYVTYSAEPHSDIKKTHVTSLSIKLPPQATLNGNIETSVGNNQDIKNIDTSREENRHLEHKKSLEHRKKSSDKPKDTSNKKCSSVKNILKKMSSDKSKGLTDQENRIPYYIRNNLRSLISQFPNGIWCAEIPEKYRKMFRKELNYQELGFNNLIDLCICLSSIFHYVRPSTEDFKLYDKSQPLPDCAEKKFTIASYSVNKKGSSNVDSLGALPRIDWADVNTFLPEDIFKPGEEIPRAFLPSGIQENDTIDVVVGEIYDLSKFWIYLQDSLLDKLMDDIQDFYKDHASKYEIPSHLVREGLYCVQVIFGEYHRALIVDIMPDVEDTIRVIFIDYGTMTKVSTNGLCFLHTKFSTFPAQAIRCRLANIMPVEEGIPWSREASKAFRKLVADRDTSAKISHINWEEQILEVYLADVTDEDNIFYINDRLIEEGYASHPDKDRQPPHVDPIYTPIVKLIHLFPTFLELEHGLAPSSSEMEVLHDCNVPINFCYPQYFYIDYSFEEEVIKNAEDFHEKNCMKPKRRVPTRFRDIEPLRAAPLDLTIFGELEPEIKAFLNRSPKEDCIHNSDEDFIDAEEDASNINESHCNNLDSITEQLKSLNVKEEETVNILKKDLLVAEDIMKDITLICKIEPHDYKESDSSSYHLSNSLCYGLENSRVKSENALLEESYLSENERQLCTINETTESVVTPNSVAFGESFGKLKEDDGHLFFEHPLSKMSFDKEGSIEGEQSSLNSSNLEGSPTYELCEPDVKLSTVNFSSLTDTGDLPSGATFISQISDLLKADLLSQCGEDSQDSDVKCENGMELCSNASTNPFLDDMNGDSDATQDLTLSKLKLNPNNPFLTYLNSSCSSNSNSTTYDSPVVPVKVVHAWSHFDDMSSETISKLGKTLSSQSSSTSSLRVTEDRFSCSMQTSNEQVRAPPMDNNCPPQPPCYPQPVAYGYTQWSLGYGNPYYMQFSNQLGYYEQPRGPFCGPSPPPGFAPLPRFTPLGPPGPSSYRHTAPQETPCYYPGGNFGPSRPGNPYAQPYYGPRPMFAPSAPLRPGTASISAVSVNVVNDGKDFYDVYNDHLRMRPDGTAK